MTRKKAKGSRSSAGAEEMDTGTESEDEDVPPVKGTARGGSGGKSQSKANRQARVDGTITRGIWHGGKVYGPGDEVAFKKLGLAKPIMQRLVNEGSIEGFGFEAEEASPETEDADGDYDTDEE